MSNLYADAPKYLVAQLQKLRLTQKGRDDLKNKYGMKVLLLQGGSVRGLPVVTF